MNEMKIGDLYNWKNQPERLVYVGTKGRWHQFEKVDERGTIWCEVLSEDMYMLERTSK
jgi:hypothetical protein